MNQLYMKTIFFMLITISLWLILTLYSIHVCINHMNVRVCVCVFVRMWIF